MVYFERRFDTYTDRRTVLSNGVTVWTRALDPRHFHPEVAVFGAHVASNAQTEKRGLGHMSEHIVASATPLTERNQEFGEMGYPSGYIPYISTSENGMYVGNNNGGGLPIDRSDLHKSMRSGLRILTSSDQSPQNIEHERDYILREQSPWRDDAHRRRSDFYNAIFPGHPLDMMLGSEADIRSITHSDIAGYIARTFTGRRLTVAATYPEHRDSGPGAVSHQSIVRVAQDELGHLLPGKAASYPKPPGFKQVDRRYAGLAYNKDSGEAEVHLVFPMRRAYTAGAIAEHAFFQNFQAQAHFGLAESGMSYHHGINLNHNQLLPNLWITFNTSPADVGKCVQLIAGHIKIAATDGMDSTVHRYRAMQDKQSRLSWPDSSEAFADLYQGICLDGKPRAFQFWKAERDILTGADINRCARALLHGPAAMLVSGDPNHVVPPLAELQAAWRRDIPAPVTPIAAIGSMRKRTPRPQA